MVVEMRAVMRRRAASCTLEGSIQDVRMAVVGCVIPEEVIVVGC